MIVNEVKPGFEKEAEMIISKKEALESEKEVAKAEALKKVDEEFAEREETISSILKLITFEVEVEDPQEEVEPEGAAVAEGNPPQPQPVFGEAINSGSIKFN